VYFTCDFLFLLYNRNFESSIYKLYFKEAAVHDMCSKTILEDNFNHIFTRARVNPTIWLYAVSGHMSSEVKAR
jgi:hypothetical protein